MNPWAICAFIGVCILLYKMIGSKTEKHFIDEQVDAFENDPDFEEVPPFLEAKKLPPITDIFPPNMVPGQNGLFMSRPFPVRAGLDFEATVWNGEKWTYEDTGVCYFQERQWYGLSEKF